MASTHLVLVVLVVGAAAAALLAGAAWLAAWARWSLGARESLERIEELLADDRANLRPEFQDLPLANLVSAALEARDDAARQGWSYAGVEEREHERTRAEFAAYLEGRAPAGAVRVTIEGAHLGTGNGSAYIVNRAGATSESSGRCWTLETFMGGTLSDHLRLALEDAEEARRELDPSDFSLEFHADQDQDVNGDRAGLPDRFVLVDPENPLLDYTVRNARTGETVYQHFQRDQARHEADRLNDRAAGKYLMTELTLRLAWRWLSGELEELGFVSSLMAATGWPADDAFALLGLLRRTLAGSGPIPAAVLDTMRGL